jgi:predicted permease
MPARKEDFQEEEIPETVPDPQFPKIWKRDEGQNGLSLLAKVTTISWNLALPPIGGALLGYYIDARTGDGGITWTLSLLALGVMVAFSNLYSLYIEHGRQKTDEDQSSDSDKENHEKE